MDKERAMKTITVYHAGVADASDEAVAHRVPLSLNRVQVRVKYAGVGFADVMAVRGGYPLAPKRPFTPGYEFFGLIDDRSSSGGMALFAPGTRVVGVLPSMGAYRETIDVDPGLLVPVPTGLDDEKAAVLPLNYLTALAMIERCAHLETGQSFLIHGAAGGVGTAALELARVLGLRAYGTASSSKHDLVRSLGGVPLDRKDDAWMDELLKLLPEGVDAAFDSFGAPSFAKSWRVLSSRGTLVCYGMSPSIDGGTADFLKGVAYIAFRKAFGGGRKVRICSTPGMVGADHEWFRESMTRILEWAAAGALRPVVSGILPWNRVADAHRELAEGRVKGKVLLNFSDQGSHHV
jgi:NADPH:quinone reductase-like Zn-dependent oxidoreductase